jgi:tetratricopeptide (TPR) repeat protein
MSTGLALVREHLQNNRLDAAEQELRAVLVQEPGSSVAQFLLGFTCYRQGRLDEAESLLADLYQKEPNQLDAVGLLAAVRMGLGQPSQVIPLLQHLIASGRQSADLFNQLGACWLQLNDPVAAGGAFKRAVELDRGAAHSYFNLGMALKMAGNSYETFATFKRAYELDPQFLDTYIQLWGQMRKLLNWREGLPILEDGMRRHPGSAHLMSLLASTYGKVGRTQDAERLYRRAIQIDPTFGSAYAHWLQEEGRFDDSLPVLRESIRSNPLQGQAYYNLTVAKCFEVDGRSLIDVVQPLLTRAEIDGEGQMFLHYALAKAHDQARQYEQAMREYDLANCKAYELYNSGFENDVEAIDSELAALGHLYSKSNIERLRQFGSESRVPIFIVGMIRTGTTLLDQILSSHRDIRSAGEQPFWQVSAGRVNRRWVERGGDPKDVLELEARYLQVLRDAAGNSPRVSDKMPTNFMHVGLMSIVFPNSKFIHIRRNPLDTAISIYTTFLGSGTQFAYNQANIVSYYRGYLETMRHWRSVLPEGQLLEIDYEDLVTNKEIVLRELFEFLELDWDEAVLNHEKNSSQVSTPSLWTARQPVNTSSVERWRRYEPWLGKLLELKELSHPPIDHSMHSSS